MRTSRPGRAAPLIVVSPLKPIALAVALALAAPHAVVAAPVGHTVVAGDVTVTQPDARTMVINQGSDKAILNWRGFSIAAGETVQFVQPGSSSVALNRVTGGAPSEIFGRLSANGKVFLVNPSGVMFGSGGSADVGALVASTLDLADDDFLAGRYVFADTGGSAGTVLNEGHLAAAERGTIALLGAQVSNGGTVTARLGTVGLAAGGKVTLDFNGDGLTRIVVDAARINALVKNGGAIISDGGQVTMTARAVNAIADTVVRQNGLVQATALVERAGRIVLDGGAEGTVALAGKIDATGLGAGQRGGAVTLLGRDIHLAAGADIDARGDAGGGSVLVGGDYQGANRLVPHAASTTMAAGATIRADALGNGAGGKVIVWSDGHTSAHGSASATGGAQGGSGGIVETSGRTLDVAGMRVKAGAAKGPAGTWLLDPGDIRIDAYYAASISDALNNSTNVTVSTRDAESDGPGDIFVDANIEKTAGGDTSLLLDASRDITVNRDVRIASLGTAGKLNVDFNADTDSREGGAVALVAGAAVLTNGGDLRIYGQDNPATGRARGSEGLADGVWLQRGATIDTRSGQSDAGPSGQIAIAGTGRNFSGQDGWSAVEGVGVRVDNATLLSTTGNITIDGIGGVYSPDQTLFFETSGVLIDLAGGPRIATGSGALAISATAGGPGVADNWPAGLRARVGGGSDISSTEGAMNFSGMSRQGLGVDMLVSGGRISSGSALSMSGSGTVKLFLDSGALVVAGGALSLDGAGGPGGGVALTMDFSTIRAFSASFTGIGGPQAPSVSAVIRGGMIETGGGGISFQGNASGNAFGDGIYLELDATSIKALGPVSLVGTGGDFGSGVLLSMKHAAIEAAGGGIAISGRGGANGDGVAIGLAQSSLSALQIVISGDGGLNGAGVSGELSNANISATNGPLTIDGTGDGPGRGVDLYMSGASISATQGDLLISGAGGDARGSGVVISSRDPETGADGSSGSNGVMTGSTARIYADRGNLTVAGANDTGSPFGGQAERVVAGLALTGIQLHAIGGDVLLAGAAVPGIDIVPAGVALTNVLVSTAAPAGSLAPGSVRILGGAAAASPALILDGVTLGGAGMDGNIIIGARNAGGGPVLSYPGNSQWANSVRTTGVVNLRPDDGNYNFDGVPASTIPISVGNGGSGFNVSFSALGIGGATDAHVIVGSEEHTGQITFHDPTPFSGHLTLQNGGAGSEGIVLLTSMNASEQVTLSSGGAVSAPESSIRAGALLLHGSQPEANFMLGDSGNTVGQFAVHFDRPASAARPEYGDVSFRNNGTLVMGGLRAGGFTTGGNQPTAIAGNNTVAGDLLLRTSDKLTLAQGVNTLGGDITLVTGTALDSAGYGLTPGGSGTWRVFADTWVGENRAGLTPSLPHPNYYNCAYGDACNAAIAGNRFIYRAQPTLTLTADSFARGYGAPNPAFTFTQAGLVNGDTLADVLSGAYTTAALQSSGVGAYPIAGAFTSAVGYAIDARPGALSIDRAALLISVDDKSKVYGGADPLLTATFAGLAPFDTDSAVTGLTLSAPTGASATAGSHPILGANATAANYVITYRQGALTVAKAPLLVAADNKSKVYGAPDPAPTATMSGFRYGDTAAAVNGLVLSAPTGAAAGAGNHAIVAQGGAAANYALSYQPGVLAVDQAVLAYVADPTRQLQGSPAPAMKGSVTGFAYTDTLSSATSGSLQFVALAPSLAPPGQYAVEGSGLTAANYRLVQAASNATALTMLPMSVSARPTIAKDITFASSNVYEKNFGSPRLCVGAGPLGSGSPGSESNDLLALEWSRVRLSPNLSNCLGLGQRNSCQDF